MCVVPGQGTKTIPFDFLWEILKSNDKSLLQENAWMFDGPDKYLDNKAKKTVKSMSQTVAYMSYPRCGNSFLRKYL